MAEELSVAEFIARQPEYDKKRRILYPLLRAILPIICKVKITGLENIPSDGKTCIMINHISYLDPIVATYAIPFRYVISLSKIENFKIPVISWFLNQLGRLFH